MKFNIQWLREWVNQPLITQELADQLTMAGLEVETVETLHHDFSGVVVARLTEIFDHPAARTLKICTLHSGTQVYKVISGAPRLNIDACYALALPGASLPGGKLIQQTEIKGEVSQAMLCSAAELGLNGETEFLLELDKNADEGATLEEYLGFPDEVFELALTPNRGDCLSIRGIAREVGVLTKTAVTPPAIPVIAATIVDNRAVLLAEPALCPRYLGRVIRGVDNRCKTPDWILERLRRCGLRSINTVVNITNYVMLELGQPMHAFNNALLTGDICVRLAREGEQLVLLDGQDCHLATDTLVITDASGPIAMAGIIGGKLTSVTETSADLFLESAYFSPDAIQGRARQYGLHTDSSHRYERGVDHELQQLAMERVSDLILRYCGGHAGPVIHAIKEGYLPTRGVIELRRSRLARMLGARIRPQICTEILNRLECTVHEQLDRWKVTPPTFRFDINLEVDLIEEIARVYGYSKVPSTTIPAELRISKRAPDPQFNQIKKLLVARGYQEVITYSFVDHALQEVFAAGESSIHLSNPISSEFAEMRQSLGPGLLSALIYNLKRQQSRVRMFEVGRIYRTNPGLEQIPVVAGILYGNIYNKQWDNNNIYSNFYNMKADVEAILTPLLTLDALSYDQDSIKAYHPHRSAKIIYNNQCIGSLGEIHPSILQQFDIPNDVYLFEIELVKFLDKHLIKYSKISKFPAIRRDLAIVLDDDITYKDVADCIQSTTSGYLENLELFDVYRGEGIDIGKKSLALGLTFQVTSSTLTDVVVEELLGKVLSALKAELGASLRE